MKYAEKVRKLLGKPEKPAFSLYELLALGVPEPYAKLLVHNMARRGEIVRLRKGWYSFHRDPLAFVFTLPPNTAYYGLGFAAYMHGAWSQVPNPEILTFTAPRKIRAGVYHVLETPVIVHRLSRRLFGSYTPVKYGQWLLPVSTPEKTLADLVYFKYPFLDEVAEGLLGKVDWKELKRILGEYPYPKSVRREVLRVARGLG